MKTSVCSTLLATLAAIIAAGCGGAPQPAQTVKSFTTADATIAKDLAVTDDQAWLANCTNAQVIRLFEVPDPGLEQCAVIYRAKLKSEGLSGRAFLEMLCRFPGKGEFFSKGLDKAVTGSSDWAVYETPFFLKQGERPELIRLNVAVEGKGKVWIKDVELLTRSLK